MTNQELIENNEKLKELLNETLDFLNDYEISNYHGGGHLANKILKELNKEIDSDE